MLAWFGSFFGMAIIAGLWHRSLTGIVSELVVTPLQGLQAARTRIGEARQRCQAILTRQQNAFDGRPIENRTSLIGGAIVATVLCVVFLLAESGTVIQTIGAMFPEIPMPQLPTSLGLMLAVSIVLPALFASWLKAEIGRPQLLHVSSWTDEEKRDARRKATAITVISIATVVALGFFRDVRLTLANAMGTHVPVLEAPSVVGAPTTGDHVEAVDVVAVAEAPEPVIARIADVVGIGAMTIGVATSLFFAFCLAGKVGPLVLLGYVRPVVIPLAILALLALALGVLEGFWTVVSGCLLRSFHFVQRIGIAIVRPAVTLMRDQFVAEDRRRQANESYSRLGHALCFVAMDFELPEDAIGGRATIDPEPTPTDPAAATPPAQPAGSGGQVPGGEYVSVNEDAADGASHEPTVEPGHMWGAFVGPDSPYASTTATNGATR